MAPKAGPTLESAFQLQGTEELLRELQHVVDETPQRAADALEEEATIELEEMRRRTPYEEGTLRETGQVHEPTIVGDDVFVRITFGGSEAPYAVLQHYKYWYQHDEGQALYVQSVLDESKKFMARRVGRRLGLAV